MLIQKQVSLTVVPRYRADLRGAQHKLRRPLGLNSLKLELPSKRKAEPNKQKQQKHQLLCSSSSSFVRASAVSLAITCMLEEQIIIYPTPSQTYPIITIRYPCYKDRVPASNKPSINNVIKTGRTQRILQTLLSQSELFFSLTAVPRCRAGLRVGALTGRRPLGLSSLTLGFFSLTAAPRCRAGLRVGALTGRRAHALSTQMGLGPSRSG